MNQTHKPELNEVSTLSAKTLLACFILFIYTIISNIFQEIGFHYLHESGLAILIGAGITFVVKIFSPEVSNSLL